jgi:Xaa-Pro dipeptidase
MISIDNLGPLYRAHVDALQRATEAALEKAGLPALAIHSGTPQKRTEADDAYWPLRPTPHFQHWLPLEEPGCVLVVRQDKRPRLVRTLQPSFWEAPRPPESDHFWSAFEVIENGDARQFLPAGAAFVGDDLRAAAALGIPEERRNPPALLAALDQLRVRKSEYEVACLAEANRRAASGHDELRALFGGADRSELELHLAYLGSTRQDDAETPYKNIVALGKHAATLHHISYEKRAAPAQSLLVDAGASFAGYCSDITRTWVKGGGSSAAAFAQLVAGVEAMQQRLCAAVRVGLPYEQLHDESHRQVGQILREVGVSRLSVEELVSRGVTRAFYPHGLGHSLGLQCHDVGCALRPPRADNPFLRNTTVMTAGQVFTIEPGIYFIDSLLTPLRESPDIDWKLVDALAAFGGVRIEDDVQVLAQGVRNLTREQLPRGGGTA